MRDGEADHALGAGFGEELDDFGDGAAGGSNIVYYYESPAADGIRFSDYKCIMDIAEAGGAVGNFCLRSRVNFFYNYIIL